MMMQQGSAGRRYAIYNYKMWLIETDRWAGRGWWLATTAAWSDGLAYLAYEAVSEVRGLLQEPQTNQALLDAKCEPGVAQLIFIQDGEAVRLWARTNAGKENRAAYQVLNHAAVILRDIAQDLEEGRQASPGRGRL